MRACSGSTAFAARSTTAHFREIAGLLPPGALVVLNETRVFPARLRGSKPSGGAVELLLTRMVGAHPDGQGGRGEIWEGARAGTWAAMQIWSFDSRAA